MKIRTPYDRDDLHIHRTDKVLEIGSGHNPTYRADVIVEKNIDTNYHRCGDVKVYPHQTFIHASGEHLPFKDKEFDYVICNQVLEHVDNPETFIRELMRVAHRGYIETPSLLGEFLFPKDSHKWIILDIDGKLVMWEKSKMPGNYSNDYGELFLNYLPYQSLPYAMLWLTDGDMTLNRYEWYDTIEFSVTPKEEYYRSFFLKKWDKDMVQKLFPPRTLIQESAKVLKASFYLLKSKLKKKLFKKYPLPIPLSEYVKNHQVLHYE